MLSCVYGALKKKAAEQTQEMVGSWYMMVGTGPRGAYTSNNALLAL